ncbi:MarR family winged helix-turn-helix transcriptional regulator [Pusillimonas caeni]|uniref:MarR family winged helix-turn-helix transcriptional regulator n=1 Tax=Pusillimonas caeni TaxID=1348472 RepID=UPI0014322D05|nr:MarR family winged helix-turn-helix transcriptional regulator [Pusillimonas caeni]
MKKRTNQTTSPVDVTQNLTYWILLLSNTLTRSAARDLSEVAEITVPEWRIISAVGSRGALSLNDLARAIAVDKAWVSRTVANLEKKGFIQRKPLLSDGRQFTLELTDSGRRLHLEISAWSLQRQERLKGAFSEQEYKQFKGFIERLQTVADTMLERPAKE